MKQASDGKPLSSKMSVEIYLSEVFRMLLFFVLLTAAWGKTAIFSLFQQNLVDSFYVPQKLGFIVAIGLIGSEWLLAFWLFFANSTRYWALLATLGLFILFSAIIIVVLVKDKLISCNCFGKAEQNISIYDLIRNLILILACSYILVLSPAHQSIALGAQLLLSGIAFIFFQLSIKLNDIAFLLRFKHGKTI